MRPAIIVVDMLKDNLKESSRNPYYQEGKGIIPNLQKLLQEGRKRGFPIVFACDSFLEGDFIFKGRMKVHSLRGTEGAEVVDELRPGLRILFCPRGDLVPFSRPTWTRRFVLLGWTRSSSQALPLKSAS